MDNEPRLNLDHDPLEAARIAIEERGRAYGPPHLNHGATAELWNTYCRRAGMSVQFDAGHVCMMMALQKICREANQRKPDNRTDICGYMQNIGMMLAEEGNQ